MSEAGELPVVGVASTGDLRRVGSAVRTGALWSGAGLVLPLVVSLVATPHFLHYFGVDEWGILALVQGVATFIAAFDGGIGLAAIRYFAIYEGEADRDSAGRLLASLVALTLAVTAALSVAAWFVMPTVVGHMNVPPDLTSSTIEVLRSVVPIVGISVVRGIFAAVVNAAQDFRLTTVANTVCSLAWLGGLLLFEVTGQGHHHIEVVFVGEQILGLLILSPAVLRRISVRHLRMMPWSSLRPVLRYSNRLQLSNVFSLVSFGLDALLVAAFLPVRDLAYYDLGAGLALQVRGTAAIALAPALTAMGNLYGRDRPALAGYVDRLQRTWTECVTGWCCVAAGSLYFGIVAWLGHAYRPAGVVAVILVVGYMGNLWSGMATSYAMTLGDAGVLVRSLVVTTACNVLCSVPGVLLGLYGIVAATSVALVVGNIYLVRLFRRRLDPGYPNYLTAVPWLGGALAGALTVALELIVRPIVPTGPAGLVLVGVPAGLALVAFTLWQSEPRRLAHGLIQRVVRHR